MMNNNNRNLHPQPDSGRYSDDDTFAQLQSLWDEQRGAVGKALALHPCPHAAHVPLRLRPSYRRVLIAAYLMAALMHIAMVVCALVVFVADGYLPYLLSGLVFVAISACVAGYSLWTAVGLWRHKPASTTVARMSAFVGGMHTTAHYASKSLADTKQRSMVTLVALRPWVSSGVAVLLLVATAAFAPHGDGYSMSVSRHADRVQFIEEVNNITLGQ